MSSSVKDLLSIKNLSVSYGNKIIVENINFNLKRGEILAIVGESGSGKSTILKAIDGLLPRNANITGEIIFEGREITNIFGEERRKLSGKSVAMIFQNAGASFCPIRKIGDQIYESVTAHRDCTFKKFREQAIDIMKSLNLEESVLDEYPFKLSGGMAQRVGILAAMILEPKLLLADEPTSALDTITQFNVVNELLKLRKRYGLSIIIVTHNLRLAKYIADEMLIMNDEFLL